MAFKRLPRQFIDIGVATSLAGPTVQIVGRSGLPSHVSRGLSGLIGAKLLTGSLRTLRFRR